MKRMQLIFAAVLILAPFMTTISCKGGSGPAVSQGTCPVMGEIITNKNHYVDYQGKRIYFCCSDCPAEFNKDPEKYMKKLDPSKLETAPAAMDGAEKSGDIHKGHMER